jgi:hypothetical protein
MSSGEDRRSRPCSLSCSSATRLLEEALLTFRLELDASPGVAVTEGVVTV